MSVATSYAKALFSAARENRGSSQADAVTAVQTIEQGLEQLSKTIQASAQARVTLESPATSAKEKVAIATALAEKSQAPELLKRFLIILAQKQRFNILPEICNAFTDVRVTAEGGVVGRVVSADALSDSDMKDLSESFSKRLGKKVHLTAKVDPSLIAGIHVVVAGVTYDGSVKARLAKLKDRLMMPTETVH